MYWPTAASRVVSATDPVNLTVVKTVRPSRRGNFFASITNDTLAVWDVRVRIYLPTGISRADIHSPQWYKLLWSDPKRVSSDGGTMQMSFGHMMVEG